MIARLRGRVVDVEGDAVILDVAGVGYRVLVPTSVLADLASGEAEVTLHTHLVVRENEWILVGAEDRAAIDLFVSLLGVGGVGPRAALSLLSALGATRLHRAIVEEDATLLCEAQGIGRKTAERIVLELKGKLGPIDGEIAASGPLGSLDAEAVEVLQALGYSRSEARRALVLADLDADMSVENRVLAALRAVARPSPG